MGLGLGLGLNIGEVEESDRDLSLKVVSIVFSGGYISVVVGSHWMLS